MNCVFISWWNAFRVPSQATFNKYSNEICNGFGHCQLHTNESLSVDIAYVWGMHFCLFLRYWHSITCRSDRNRWRRNSNESNWFVIVETSKKKISCVNRWLLIRNSDLVASFVRTFPRNQPRRARFYCLLLTRARSHCSADCVWCWYVICLLSPYHSTSLHFTLLAFTLKCVYWCAIAMGREWATTTTKKTPKRT